MNEQLHSQQRNIMFEIRVKKEAAWNANTQSDKQQTIEL